MSDKMKKEQHWQREITHLRVIKLRFANVKKKNKKFSSSELSRVSGAAWSSRDIRSGFAEFHVYSLSGAIPSAISHSRRIDYADLLGNRSRTARDAQLYDSRLANFTVGRFRAHRDHCVVYLVRGKNI